MDEIDQWINGMYPEGKIDWRAECDRLHSAAFQYLSSEGRSQGARSVLEIALKTVMRMYHQTENQSPLPDVALDEELPPKGLSDEP